MTKLYSHNLPTRQKVQIHISQMNPDKEWVYTIEKKVERRTLSQNALYHQWLDIIREDQGNDHDDQGQIMMRHLIAPTHEATLPDGSKEERWSTTRLDVGNMSAYMDALSRWAASENISLPHPEDAHER